MFEKHTPKINILKSAILCAALALTVFMPAAVASIHVFPTRIALTNTAIAAGAPSTTGGIVPCGRTTDNPDTTNNETDQCSLCHLAFIANNVVLFFFGIASVMALLAFVIAGFLYILTGANPASKTQAKTAIENIVKGYIIIFCSWLIIDFVLSAWGFIDPLGGEWSVVCNLFSLSGVL